MKRKISISVEDDLINRLEDELTKGIFRNRSHIIELALTNFIKQQERKQ